MESPVSSLPFLLVCVWSDANFCNSSIFLRDIRSPGLMTTFITHHISGMNFKESTSYEMEKISPE